jgi:hypothetical protein
LRKVRFGESGWLLLLFSWRKLPGKWLPKDKNGRDALTWGG